MLPFTLDGAPTLVGSAHPTNAVTTYTVTGDKALSIPTNDFEALAIDVYYRSPDTGAKTITDLDLWECDAVDDTVGTGGWTEVAQADFEAAAGDTEAQTLSASAAYDGVKRFIVPMRLFNKKFVNVIVTGGCPDPTTVLGTVIAVVLTGIVQRRKAPFYKMVGVPPVWTAQ
jgi:hypothetical protein